MMKHRKLLALCMIFAAGYVVTRILSAPESLFGLSTVLGTTVLGTTVLGTTVMGVTVGQALASSQLYLSLACIGLLVFLELSDPSYGEIGRILTQIRSNWLPYTVFLVLLFFLIVAFKIASIIGI